MASSFARERRDTPHINAEAVRRILDLCAKGGSLGDDPLTKLHLVQVRQKESRRPDTPEALSLTLREILNQAVGKLRPAGPEPKPDDYVPESWQLYWLIRHRYLIRDRKDIRYCCREMQIERTTYYRRLNRAIGKLSTILFAMEDAIHIEQDDIGEPAGTYRRLKYYVTRKLDLDGTQHITNYEEIQALGELESVERRRVSFSADFDPCTWKLDLKEPRRDSPGIVSWQRLPSSEALLRWKVVFSPPLNPGERASYEWHQCSSGGIAMCSDEIQEDIARGKRDRAAECVAVRAIAPIADLRIGVIFPPRYPISFPPGGGFRVLFSGSDDLGERNRLAASGAFHVSHDEEKDIWMIELQVQDAKIGYSYEVTWIPPFAASLVQQ